ncbi:MAG: cytochrome c maturation protein CcmE [Ignavibacteria bacterium]|jgi:cytochrome c-type biogenesis protein CcmE|nr:cytochrome c maturation protein CcmE [Ignavibacteria bacterium]MBK9226060.1 cytochrome c maturation protein CcmE [Ignavibacteria bacterium]
MSKKAKLITGILIILVFVVVGFMSFMDNKIEYVNFAQAKDKVKTVEVKGQWVKDKESKFDPESNTFSFYMVDDFKTEMKVVLAGAKPNNFEVAEAVVAKGKVKNGDFHAKEVLTKCPSKYEAQGKDVQKTEQKY